MKIPPVIQKKGAMTCITAPLGFIVFKLTFASTLFNKSRDIKSPKGIHTTPSVTIV